MSHFGFQYNHPELTLDSHHFMEASHSSPVWEMIQRIFAAITLTLALPLLALLFIAVKTTSKGPFIFKQQRVGLNGSTFEVFKIRSMRSGSETNSALGVNNTSYHVTKIGKVLRVLKLDELPQLWNIVKGDMNLVGPRPIPLALNAKLSTEIPGFENRYEVKPGLTSIGQICIHDNELGEGLVDDWKIRFEGELHYIRNRNFRYDLLMVLMTSLYVLKKLFPFTESTISELNEQANQTSEKNLLNIPISALNYQQISQIIINWAKTHQSKTVGVCNVHSVTSAGWEKDLKKALISNDLNTADGMPLVWMLKLLGNHEATRVYGPTLMLHLLKHASEKNLKVAFYGGHKDRLKVLIQNLEKRYKGIRIVEAISPPFGNMDPTTETGYIDQLRAANPHLVFVGLGCPKQEIWMQKHRADLNAVLIGVGAAFDFHANAVPQAPAALQKLGLEWAYRLFQEPRRLAKRYLTTNPVFIVRAGLQLFKTSLSKIGASTDVKSPAIPTNR